MPVRYKGTSANDKFILDPAALSQAMITAGTGYDTLKVNATGSFSFSSSSFVSLSGIDELDFTAHQTGQLEVRLTSSMMSQSDAGQLTVLSGAGGIDLLKAGASVGGKVFVAGTGNVYLDGTTDNVVSMKAGATAHVFGGAGNDTITAASTGSFLDGGAGNDTLITGAGADTVVFGTGDKVDRVTGFNVAADKIDLGDSGLAWSSEVLARLKDGAGGAVLDLGNGNTLTLAGVKAADLTASNFLGVQQGAPTIHVAPGTTAAQLNAILDGAGPGATVILDQGSFTFDQSIVIRHDGVTLKGASETGTVVTFAFPSGTGDNGFEVLGGAKTYLAAASTDIAKGAMQLTLADTSGIKAGEKLYIAQDNDAAYLAAHGWSDVDPTKLAGNPFREAIVEVDRVVGNTVYLKQAIQFDMQAGLAKVYDIDLVEGVHLSDLTVQSNLGAANPYNFINPYPEFDDKALVHFEGTYGAVIEHVTARNAGSHSFDVRTSLKATVDDIYVDGAHDKGTDGNGYGVQIYETFDSSFTNLQIYNTRHAVLFSSWDAEANNRVHVLDTNRDINWHGSEDVNNSVVVDRAVLAYDPAQNQGVGSGIWPIVGDGGDAHANTDFYLDNSVKFGFAIGSDQNEKIFAVDTGAYLNGRNGQDTLIGGAGDDILVGGLNKDTMTGGGGSDLFLFRVGDNYDRIKDFQTGPGGDKIVISGAAAVDGIEDLQITQSGADVSVRYGANSTIILEGKSVADITAASFVFDPLGSGYGHLF